MWLIALLAGISLAGAQSPYLGQEVGSLITNAHEVTGTVYIVDAQRIRIRDFHYDGQGPDAFFWAGSSSVPDPTGTIIPNEMNSEEVLGMYAGADIILTLPADLTVDKITWLSVWCRQFSVNFGYVMLPGAASCTPGAIDVGTLTSNSHGLSSETVTIMDAKTIQVQAFYYDGTAPDAYFYVGSGEISAANGSRVVVAMETSGGDVLGAYTGETVTLSLPGVLLATDVQWISVYSQSEGQSFGDITLPTSICVPPYIEAATYMYWGEKVGSLVTKSYRVQGDIYVVDSVRLYLRGFSYTGQGPDAYFYIGLKGQHGSSPQAGGIIVNNELGSAEKLGAYDNVNLVLTLPQNIVAAQIAWFSVWCEAVTVDFGSAVFPDNFLVPAEVNLGGFVVTTHEVNSGDVIVKDKRTLFIPQFSYDGTGPDAYFYVGSGIPSSSGTRIPNELGSIGILGRYDSRDITLELPGGVDVDTIDYLSVWCDQVTVDFGHVNFPAGPLTVPPYIPGDPLVPLTNCKSMNPNFNVAWEVQDSDIVFEFTGNIGVSNGYMAFGVSGSDSRSSMIGADPMIVYLDNGSPKVIDYTISAYSLCSGGQGVCPDTMMSGAQDLDVLDTRLVDGVTTVRFRRPLVTADDSVDKNITTSEPIYVVWATGEVNDLGQVTKHTERVIGDLQLDFGAVASLDCQPVVGSPEEEVTPWPALAISGRDTQSFTAQIGLSGGKKGYGGITGSVSWGIAWYINGLLIPELTVNRGVTYTFTVEGGQVPANQAKYHPLYITDDPLGGYVTKTDEQKQAVNVYAGTVEEGGILKGTDGRYCEYLGNADPNDYDTFEAYKTSLTLECESGDPGVFTWTPDENTPDLVYYQCFTHNYLGWKIHVVDEFPPSEPSCESLDPDFNVEWLINGSYITFSFTGAIDLDTGYMAFGVSGSSDSSSMIGSDPMVVSMDRGVPTLHDYDVTEKLGCGSPPGPGVCPDRSQDLELLQASVTEGVTTVRFRRQLDTGDLQDKAIPRSGDVYVVWSLGRVNMLGLPTKHTKRLQGDTRIDFSRPGLNDCTEVKAKATRRVRPWQAAQITLPENREFTAKIGPAGEQKGYGSITGKASVGVAWYLNGLLLPELTVERGQTYTFKVYGGNNPDKPLEYFPLYLTDDPVGGYALATTAEKQKILLLAGTTNVSNTVRATEGAYCDYTTSADPYSYDSFESWSSTFQESPCDGVAGQFEWTPNDDTPDVVFYQAFTQNYLGWKINVQSPADEFRVSNLKQEDVESAFFVLVALCFVFLVVILMLGVNYTALKSALKKEKARHSHKI